MPDEPRLFEHLTVSDHLTLAARLYQVEDAAEKGRAQKQRPSAGVEAMGMRLLSFGMFAVVLLVASIPAAAIGGLLFFLLKGVLGFWAIPFAALFASLPLWAEAALGIVLPARPFREVGPVEGAGRLSSVSFD